MNLSALFISPVEDTSARRSLCELLIGDKLRFEIFHFINRHLVDEATGTCVYNRNLLFNSHRNILALFQDLDETNTAVELFLRRGIGSVPIWANASSSRN